MSLVTTSDGGNAYGTREVSTSHHRHCWVNLPLFLQTCCTCMVSATATFMTELPEGKVCSPRANLGLFAYTEWHWDKALPWLARTLAACLGNLLRSSRSPRWSLGSQPSGPRIRAAFLLYGCWTSSPPRTLNTHPPVPGGL